MNDYDIIIIGTGAELRKRLGTKRIYMLGLVANLLAMTLLVASRFVMKDRSLAYRILLAATACTIAAFGVGPLQTWAGLDLSIIYGGTAVVALAMAAVSFVVIRKSSAPA